MGAGDRAGIGAEMWEIELSVFKSASFKNRSAVAMILGAGALVWACSSVAQPAPTTASAPAPSTPVAAAPAAAPAPAAPAAAADQSHAKATFEALCSSCHDTSLASDARYSREGWQQVIDRMYGFGLAASDEQAKEVLDYLAATFPAN